MPRIEAGDYEKNLKRSLDCLLVAELGSENAHHPQYDGGLGELWVNQFNCELSRHTECFLLVSSRKTHFRRRGFGPRTKLAQVRLRKFHPCVLVVDILSAQLGAEFRENFFQGDDR